MKLELREHTNIAELVFAHDDIEFVAELKNKIEASIQIVKCNECHKDMIKNSTTHKTCWRCKTKN